MVTDCHISIFNCRILIQYRCCNRTYNCYNGSGTNNNSTYSHYFSVSFIFLFFFLSLFHFTVILCYYLLTVVCLRLTILCHLLSSSSYFNYIRLILSQKISIYKRILKTGGHFCLLFQIVDFNCSKLPLYHPLLLSLLLQLLCLLRCLLHLCLLLP